ncbi:MAG TPA: type II toxin-antitoxin system PemK/MazF family toxin [Xenococcaceae cyanobacterium]
MRDYRLGTIWLVNFEPSIGTEIQKTRPALIISSSDFNQIRKKVTLLPITSRVIDNSKIAPVVVKVKPNKSNGLSKNSTIIVIEPNTFDKQRLIKFLGKIDSKILKEVKQKLQVYLDFVS